MGSKKQESLNVNEPTSHRRETVISKDQDYLLGSGIAEVTRQLRLGNASPVALVDMYLARIRLIGAKLNAFLTVMADEALEDATRTDPSAGRELLSGIPVAVKDNFAVAGVRMTVGSDFLRYYVSPEDAEVVQRLRKAGAIILGKLHLHEWAIGATSVNPHYGPARNPWDWTRTPGGSSGGAGIAVAADLALASVGSDTGGSVRIPAALTGVCGLRPTYGRVSSRGLFPLSWSFDTPGPLARRVEDVARVLQVISGFDPADPTSADVAVEDFVSDLPRGIEGVRIGLATGYFVDQSSPGVYRLLRRAADVLEDLGARVEEVILTGVETTQGDASTLTQAEAAAVHATRLREEPERFGADVLERLRIGASVTGPEYAAARHAGRLWRRYLDDVLRRYDVIITPTCPGPAPLLKATDGVETSRYLTRFTYPFSLANVPSLSVPCGFVEGRLPVGMQLIGRRWSEALIMRVGHAYQQATQWHLERAPIPHVKMRGSGERRVRGDGA